MHRKWFININLMKIQINSEYTFVMQIYFRASFYHYIFYNNSDPFIFYGVCSSFRFSFGSSRVLTWWALTYQKKGVKI